MTNLAQSSSQRVGQLVEAYESAVEIDGTVRLDAFLPRDDDPLYHDIAAELLRVDLEKRWERGEHPALSEYRNRVPRLFESPRHLHDLAYEEYRLRHSSGEPAESSAYREQYNVDTTGWPAYGSATVETTRFDVASTGVLQALDVVERMPQLGSQFDEFQLVDELGHGAFAKVFLARQSGLAGRHVALKVSVGESRESEKLARLQHTNIVPVYSVHQQDEFHGLCMPYLGSVTLDEVLTRLREMEYPPTSGTDLVAAIASLESDPQPEAWRSLNSLSYSNAVVTVLSSIVDGLAFAHSQGIVHRDIKPANVLLGSDGQPRLLDFNLSDDVLRDDVAHLFVGGTLPYMSIEQLTTLQNGGSVGPTSDVFSCGVLLFELLALRPPYPLRRGHYEDVVDSMIADRQGPVPLLNKLDATVSSDLCSIVEKCLRPDKETRYASARSLHEDLVRHLNNHPLVHAPNRSISERCRKWVRRHPQVASTGTVAMVAGLVTVLAVVGFLARGQRLAVAEAKNDFNQFQKHYAAARAALSMPATDPSLLKEALEIGDMALAGHALDENDQLRQQYRRLPTKDHEQLRNQAGELLYLSAARLNDLAGDNRTKAIHRNRLAGDFLGPNASHAINLQRKVLSQPASEEELRVSEKELFDAANSERHFDTDTNRDRYLAAVAAMENREYEVAAQLLTILRENEPLDAAVWFLSGNANVGLGELSGADACFTTYLGLSSNSHLGYFYRGRCRFSNSDWVGARADFSKALEFKPNFTAALLNRGLTHQEFRDFEAAEADYSKAIEFGSDGNVNGGSVSTRVYFLRSMARQQLGNREGARADWQLGIELTPNDEQAWVARGTALIQHSPEGALRDFDEALALNPRSHDAYQNSVYVLIEVLDRKIDALARLADMLRYNANDSVALAARAVLQARMGRRDEMLVDVERLLAGDPSAKSVYQAACAFALTSNKDDTQRALQLLARSIEQDSEFMKMAKTDPDLAAIRELTPYHELVEATDRIRNMAGKH